MWRSDSRGLSARCENCLVNNDDVERLHAENLTTIDPLLGLPEPLAPVGGDVLLRAESGGSVALGLARHHRTTAEKPDALWGALSRHSLDIRLAGPERAEALEALLTRWLAEAASGEDGDDWESSATVTVPSRDHVYARALLRHGFGPNGSTAVRRRGAAGPALEGTAEGIRHATAADLDAIADLDLQLMRHDGQFGGVGEREGARGVLRAGLAQRFQAAPDWTWVLEREGRVVGFAHVLPPTPGEAGGTTAFGAESAYIVSVFIDPSVRGSQLGARLATTVHEALDAAGVPVTTLSHAVPNPQSTPFWARMGYRPLWTTWQRRPVVLNSLP